MWELVELKPVGDHYAVHAFEDNLLVFGVGPATVEAIRASTARPAPAPTPAPSGGAAGDFGPALGEAASGH
jgi:hypothetical protein